MQLAEPLSRLSRLSEVFIYVVITFLLCSVALPAKEVVEVIDQDGRSLKGIPEAISPTHLTIRRASDKRLFEIQLSRLTRDSIARVTNSIKQQDERRKLDEAKRLSKLRESLVAYRSQCVYGNVTIYSGVKECASDLNSYRTGVTLIAPDSSKFHFSELARHGVDNREKLRKYVNEQIEKRFRGKTAQDRQKILSEIVVKNVEIGGWKGFEVTPATHMMAIRSCFLERDGRFIYCNHYAPRSPEFYKASDVAKLDIDQEEWELVISLISFE